MIKGFYISDIRPIRGELTSLHKSCLGESTDIVFLEKGNPAILKVWEDYGFTPKHTLRTSPVESFTPLKEGEMTIRTANTVYTLTRL